MRLHDCASVIRSGVVVVDSTPKEDHGHTAGTKNGNTCKALSGEAVGKSKTADLKVDTTKEVKTAGTSPGDEQRSNPIRYTSFRTANLASWNPKMQKDKTTPL